MAVATQASTRKIYQQYFKEWAGCCAQEGVPNNVISAPEVADVLVHLFMIGLAWCQIGIYNLVISAFSEPHCHKKKLPVILSFLN